ncbi:MAG: hypothetical protein DME02_22755 [Candidatus Rokuibacteriota bacterium]|nr:MAG: hypothetical protein DME02_22755 [Candidatus Rokubacteria bacterium]
MKRAVAVLCILALPALSGCASSAPARQQAGRPFDDVRRLTVVVSGESQFNVVEHSAEPGRTFDALLKWSRYGTLLKPIAGLVHQAINWLMASDSKTDAAGDLRDVSPSQLVARAFEETVRASGRFEEIRTLGREPVGDDRRRDDVVVRLTVPAWGLVRVSDGDPGLLSAFADVRAEMIALDTGTVLWKNDEDVTDSERLPLKSFTGDRPLTRQRLIDVLQRAGRRMANELLYARSAGR